MSGLSQYAFRVISRRRIHLVSHRLAPKKVGLSGNTAPADLNTVRTGRNLDNSAGPGGKQVNAKEKTDFGKYFLIAAIVAGAGAIIQFILIPALGSSVSFDRNLRKKNKILVLHFLCVRKIGRTCYFCLTVVTTRCLRRSRC